MFEMHLILVGLPLGSIVRERKEEKQTCAPCRNRIFPPFQHRQAKARIERTTKKRGKLDLPLSATCSWTIHRCERGPSRGDRLGWVDQFEFGGDPVERDIKHSRRNTCNLKANFGLGLWERKTHHSYAMHSKRCGLWVIDFSSALHRSNPLSAQPLLVVAASYVHVR